MPTVTVLAWCLMASTGRVSSSMALRERGGEVLDHDAGRADLAVLDLVRRRAATMPSGVAEQRREPHRGAGLEVAVVVAGAQAVEEPGGQGLRARGAAPASRASPSPPRLPATAVSMAARASRSGRAWASMASAAS